MEASIWTYILYYSLILGQFVLLLIAILLIIYIGYVAYNLPNMKKVPFVPTTRNVVKIIIKNGLVKPTSTFCEIGSGSGTVFLRIAKYINPAKCVGIERSKLLCMYARLNSILKMVSPRKYKIICDSIENVSIENFDTIFIFMTEDFIKDKLTPKFKKELKPGSIIISNMFKVPTDEKIKLIKELPADYLGISKKMSYLRVYQVNK